MRTAILIQACAAAATITVALPAEAQVRHHRHHVMRHQVMRAPAGAAAPQRDPREFYPNEIEGGVSGNLPFNNQIRKMRDPLNANGAGK